MMMLILVFSAFAIALFAMQALFGILHKSESRRKRARERLSHMLENDDDDA